MNLDREICPNELELSTQGIDLNILNAEKLMLKNGIEVFYFNNNDTELVKIDLVFQAGGRYQPMPLIAAATNNMLTEGTKNKTAEEIANFLEFRGSYIEKSAEKDMASVTVYMLKKYIEEVVPLLHEIICESVFPQAELELYLRKKKQQFLVDNQKVSYLARSIFNETIFGEHHFYSHIPKIEDFDRVEREQLIKFHTDFYLQNPFKIIASGNIDKELLSALDTYFGQMIFSNQHIENNSLNAVQQQGKKDYKEVSNAVQSAIRIGNFIEIPSVREFHYLSILNTLLGGYFGSRLMKNIREEKGYTYGIYSALQQFKECSVFFITAEVGVEYTQAAVDEIFLEIEKIIQTPVEQEELELVKNYLIGNFLRTLDGIFEISERYKDIIQTNLPADFYKEYLLAIETCTPEALQQVAQKYLQPQTLCTVCVGKM